MHGYIHVQYIVDIVCMCGHEHMYEEGENVSTALGSVKCRCTHMV